MAFKKGIILFLVLVVNWAYSDARGLDTYDIKVMPVDDRVTRGESRIPEALKRNEQLCTLCEEYTALATKYLHNNKTEAEIIETLHQACSQLHSFEQQCVVLVDYYAQLFFLEIGKMHPEEFCTKVNLCEKISASPTKRDDTCTLCHQVVVEILAKLTDPDSQLEIIQILLKECSKMQNYAKECKRLVFRYGPLILVNGEKFLESTDICASIHACRANLEDGVLATTDETLVLDE